MKQTFLILILLILAGTAVGVSYGQQLVYTPVNPSFGGSPFNASWLLSEAQAQNSFSAPASNQPNPYSSNPLDDFKNTLNRQILSQLSSELITKTFGEGGKIKPGHYEIGDYVIDIAQSLEGITITIIDNATGAQSSILVPFF